MIRSAILIAFAAGGVLGTATPAESELKPVISVASTGRATAKPDLAIVFVSVRSSAPLAADALDQNKKKTQEVKTKLGSLGYKETQVKFSGNRFAPTGQGMYFAGGQRPTGFDVYNNIYVLLEGGDLKNIDEFNVKVGLLLDELSKLGATPVQMPISSLSMGGASIVAFTVKDPSAQEKQAFADAMEKAKPIADEIARRMGVKITGVDSANASPLSAMMGGPANPLDELTYEYLSSSIDEVPIRTRVEVRYSYR